MILFSRYSGHVWKQASSDQQQSISAGEQPIPRHQSGENKSIIQLYHHHNHCFQFNGLNSSNSTSLWQ